MLTPKHLSPDSQSIERDSTCEALGFAELLSWNEVLERSVTAKLEAEQSCRRSRWLDIRNGVTAKSIQSMEIHRTEYTAQQEDSEAGG